MKVILSLFVMVAIAMPVMAQDEQKKKPKVRRVRNEAFSTKFDFEESVLQGQMKVPLSVVLKGRRASSKGQIIELRKNFRNELRSSRPGVLRHSK